MSTRQYEVLECKSVEELKIKVTTYLDDGWNLNGGITISETNDWRKKKYIQSLFKINKE
jgi:hypothetical protein